VPEKEGNNSQSSTILLEPSVARTQDAYQAELDRLVLTCTDDAAKYVDFSDLVSAESGCTITDTAKRAISLDQLELIIAHLRRRLADDNQVQEVWIVWNMEENKNNKELTANEEVTLYSLSTYMINAATSAQKTSLVEFMASGEQNPDFFVSQ
jgi:hypothetical protein